MLKRHWLLVLFATAIVVIGVWIVSGSQSFKSCVHDNKNDKTYGSLLFARQHLQFDCAGYAIDKHNAIVLAIATAVIAIFTVGLWISTDGLLAHGQDVERAYISGGGPINPQKTPHHHVLTIQNYGKTPGYLHHYTVVVTNLMTVQTTKPIYLSAGHRRQTFKDSISPNAPMKEICQTPITVATDPIVYGRFWYKDIWNKEHYFSFILPLYRGNDHSTVEGVDEAYTKWT